MSSIKLDKTSQADLWRHMHKESVVRLVSEDEYRNREALLTQLEEEVESGRYSPRPIHGFLSSPKGNGVARFVPVLSFQDIAVYFGCVSAFDEKLASLAVEDTYGGWSLGGKRRKIEEEWAKATFADYEDYSFDDYAPVSTYNRWAWVKNWQEFWKLLAAKSEKALDDSYFAMFDIANFYDSIDLPRLERELRKHCPEESFAIEVLFYLLSTWNKNLNQYARTTKGIPMDIVGDCSRVLANFYLTPFDRVMREKSQDRKASFMRFTDDMVLACPDLKTCKDLVFFASTELHRLGLNINVAKVKYLSKEEFDIWWGFGILDNFEVEDQVVEGLNQLNSTWNENFGRRYTVLKRAITILAKLTEHIDWQRWAYKQAIASEEFLLELNERQMQNLLTFSENMVDSIKSLSFTILNTPYTTPKACLLRCLERFRNHEDFGVRNVVSSVISVIDKLDDPVLNLAIKNMPAEKSKSMSDNETSLA